MKLRIFTTGGTIDKVYFDQKSEFQVGESQVGLLLAEANVGIEFEVSSLFRKDSLELTPEDRLRILEAVEGDPADRVIVTHGTDTMVETAQVLQSCEGKVVVLTGAMQPARLRSSDAVFNVGFAVAAVQLLSPGVYIAMNGRIFEPRNVRKNVGAGRFESLDGSAKGG